MNEEQRAKAYRDEQKRIVAARKAADDALFAPYARAAEVRQTWKPMTDFVRVGPDIGDREDTVDTNRNRRSGTRIN